MDLEVQKSLVEYIQQVILLFFFFYLFTIHKFLLVQYLKKSMHNQTPLHQDTVGTMFKEHLYRGFIRDGFWTLGFTPWASTVHSFPL